MTDEPKESTCLEARGWSTLTTTELTGSFGRWQVNIALFYFIAYILTTFNNLGYSFQAAKTDYQCEQYSPDHSQLTSLITNSNVSNDCEQCLAWRFNNSINFEQTITSQFNLTCGREWMSSFSQSIYQIGYVLSGLIIGYLSDSFGRYQALRVALAFEILGGVILIISKSIYVYMFSRLVLGFGDSGRGLCLYMLIIETVGTKQRTDVILGTSFGWVVGYMLLPLVAYFVRSYQYLQLLPTLVMTFMILLWLPHLPESPRWLLTHKHYGRAKKVLEKACKHNGKIEDFEEKFLSLQIISAEKSEESNLNNGTKKPKSTILKLLSTRRYKALTSILWFSFFVNGFIYHGFSLNIEIIGGSMFLNFALAGLVEIPSMALNVIGMRCVGRRTFTICTVLAAGLSYALIIILRLVWAMPSDHVTLITFSMLGKMFIFSTYNAIYIHASEIFPTELRHTGVSSCSIAARAGSTIAPFVKEFSSKFGLTVTAIMFCSMSLLTAFLTAFLPETKDKELVDRVD